MFNKLEKKTDKRFINFIPTKWSNYTSYTQNKQITAKPRLQLAYIAHLFNANGIRIGQMIVLAR